MGRSVPLVVLCRWSFCAVRWSELGPFWAWVVLSLGPFWAWVVSSLGRFVMGRFVMGRFVCAPDSPIFATVHPFSSWFFLQRIQKYRRIWHLQLSSDIQSINAKISSAERKMALRREPWYFWRRASTTGRRVLPSNGAALFWAPVPGKSLFIKN
jgi:hypothetical protein